MMKKLLIAMIAAMLLAGLGACAAAVSEPELQAGAQQQTPERKNARVTVVVAFDQYQDAEFAGVKNALAQSGIALDVVSTQKGEAAGMQGGRLPIGKTIGEVDDYGLGVVVIGGAGAPVLWDNEDLISLVRRADENADLVGAICLAPGALANAGLLSGGQASWFGSADLDAIMAAAGCENSGLPVTQAGNIITGNGPAAADEFGETIAQYLDAE